MAGNSRCVQRVDQLALGQCLGRTGSRTGKAIADSLVPAGVAHLLYSSGGAAGKGHTGMGHFDSYSQIEDHVRPLPTTTTIKRPASFMEMMMLPGMRLNTGLFHFFRRLVHGSP